MTVSTLQLINLKVIMFSVIGLGLSVYALIVENKVEHDKNYVAMCDINERISCTKAFTSEYGKGFGLIPTNSIFYQPNSVYGIIHYCIVILLSLLNSPAAFSLLSILVILSNCASIYFAFILSFILEDLCVVCVSIYVVNAILLLNTFAKYTIIRNQDERQKKEE